MTRALTLIVSAALGAACAGRDDRVEYVAIGPEVEVVAGASEPVFRANNAYWLFSDGRWFRSDDLRGAWVRIETPPRALASITEPRRYANYQPDTRTVSRGDSNAPAQGPEVRNSVPRPQPPAPYPRPPQQEPPTVPSDQVPEVPEDPTIPSEPDSTPATPDPVPQVPYEQGRPDRMRDR